MFEATSAIMIRRPAADVFDFISRLENDPVWCPEVRVVTPEDEGPPRVGKRFEMMARPIPESQWGGYEITQLQPPRFMELMLWQGSSKGVTTYQLEESDDGTHLTYTTRVELSPWRRILEPLVGLITRRHMGPRMLRNLKAVLEGGT